MGKYLVFLLVFISLESRAQMWFDVGAVGSFNSTWLFSNNIFNDKNVSSAPGWGGMAGGKVGVNFNAKFAIAVEVIYNQLNQHYGSSSGSWAQDVKLNMIAIPLLFRHFSESSWVEIGPQYSMITSAVESFSSSPSQLSDFKNQDAVSSFSPTDMGLVFGFGSFIAGTDNLYISLGARFTYGFTDLLSDAGGKGTPYPSGNGSSKSYTAMHAITGGLMLEVNYDLGYLTSSKCRKTKFLFF